MAGHCFAYSVSTNVAAIAATRHNTRGGQLSGSSSMVIITVAYERKCEMNACICIYGV